MPPWAFAGHAVLGIHVFFRAHITPKARDRLHHSLGATLRYRGRRLPIDLVFLPDPRANAKRARLEQLCDGYRGHGDEVALCEVNEPLPIGQESKLPCTPPGAMPVASLAFTATEEVAAKINGCPLFPEQNSAGVPTLTSPEHGRETPFWSQEAIGGPEAAEFMRPFELAAQLARKPKVPVGIADGGFFLDAMPGRMSDELQACSIKKACPGFDSQKDYDSNLMPDPPLGVDPHNHGTMVSHLIVDPSPVGVGSGIELTRIAEGDISLVKATDQLFQGAAATQPKVINLSLAANNLEATRQSLKTMSQHAIVVGSAGNAFPDPVDVHDFPGIQVGSLDSDGLASDFSQEGPEVFISAPSDSTQQSLGAHRKPAKLGGTSGAAPLVSSTIATAMSLLPGLTLDEAKLLLRNTAIPTAGTENGRGVNGVGSLNEYRALRAAARLADGWPGNRDRLKATQTYAFGGEAKTLIDDALARLAGKPTCAERQAAAKALRQGFFLDPSNLKARAALAALYRDQGYESQARFYDDPARTTQLPSTQKALQERITKSFAGNLAAGDLKRAELLIQQGADIHAHDAAGSFALESAFHQKGDQALKFLEAHGVKLSEAGYRGLTAALDADNLEGFSTLVKGGADLKSTNAAGNTVLMGLLSQEANERGPNFARKLATVLAAGADPNRPSKSGNTPLSEAIGYETGDVDSVRTLLAAKADPNTPSTSGTTPLMLAAQGGNVAILKLLLCGGASLEIKSPEGFTAEDFASLKPANKTAFAEAKKGCGK